jgi:O-antigen/teichoic acid export membrane protein
VSEAALVERVAAIPADDAAQGAVQGASRAGKRLLDGAGLLSAATALSGVLAYVFQVIAARALGPTSYGLVAVLWAGMFLLVVLLFRPLEQMTARAIADRLARGVEVRSVIRAAGALYVATSLVVGLVAVAVWEPVTSRLFLGDDVFMIALVAGVIWYGVEYLVRGICGGTRWFEGYGWALIGDGAARVLVILPVIVGASQGFAAAAVAAAAVGGVLVPVFLGKARLGPLLVQGDDAPFRLRSALAFAGPAGVIAGADQVIVNGGPLLVMIDGAGGSTRVAGVVFAATMLVRIPVYLFQGLAASLLPNLTTLHVEKERTLFRRAIHRMAFALGAGSAAMAAGAWLVGPQAMRMVFGPGFDAGRTELALLGVGVGLYLTTATVSQGMLALDAVRVAAVSWFVAAAVFVGGYVVAPGDELMRISIAFCASSGVGAVLLSLSLARRLRH